MTPPTQRPQDVWKAAEPAAPARPRAGVSRPWLGATLVLGALAGAAAGLFLYLRPDPEPVFLAVPVTEYAHPDWPPNPWAEADARGLRDRFPRDGAQTFQAQEKARILHELNRAADAGRDGRRPVVVYVSALGVVAADGRVYLIPGDARPDEQAGRLTLDELFRPLCRAGTRRLLLVLDVRPRSVVAGGDVNEALDAELRRLDEAGDLPFFVLTANTPPAGANVIRPLKRTAFGLALARAAAGAADGWNPSRSKNLRVSVGEFAAYVREVTHTLSVAYDHPPQLPRLHGKGAEFVLRHVPPGGPPDPPTPAEPEPYPDWLRKAWEDRDGWVKDGLHRRAPGLTHEFTLTAARAEQRWLAGYDPRAVERFYLPKMDELRKAASTLRAPVPLAWSVARARMGLADEVKVAAAAPLRPVFDKIADPAGLKKDGATAAMQAAWAKPADVPPFDATAVAIFDFALSLENPTVEQVKALSALAGGFRPKPRHPELLALELVAGLPPGLVARWPAGTTRTILLAARAAEEAVAFDGRSLPWVRAKLDEADRERRKAMQKLCDPESPQVLIESAAGNLTRVTGEYQEVRDAANALRTARLEFEEARAELADLAVAFPHSPAPVPEEVATGRDRLVENVLRLDALLRRPDAPAPPRLEELAEAVRLVRKGRERLRGLVRVPPPGATARQLEEALLWPQWTAAEREELLRRLDETGRAAAARVLEAWPKEPSGREPAAPPRAAPGPVRDVRWDVGGPELAQWREDERVFHRWLESRYTDEAKFVCGLGSKTAVEQAAALDALARDFRDWSP